MDKNKKIEQTLDILNRASQGNQNDYSDNIKTNINEKKIIKDNIDKN